MSDAALADFWASVSAPKELLAHSLGNTIPAVLMMTLTSYLNDMPDLRTLAFSVVGPAVALSAFIGCAIWLYKGKRSIPYRPWPGPWGRRSFAMRLLAAATLAIMAAAIGYGAVLVFHSLGLLAQVRSEDVALSAFVAVAITNLIWTLKLRHPLNAH